MSEAEAVRAYREMLPVETIHPDISAMKIRKYDMPIGILYERGESLLTTIYLLVREGERSLTRYEISKLKIS